MFLSKNKKIKRSVVSAVTMTVALNSTLAFAECTVDVENHDDSRRTFVSGNVDMRDYGYTDFQLRDVKPYSPLQIKMTITDDDGKLVHTDQTTVDDDGNFSFEFVLLSEDAEYNMKLTTPYCAVYDGTFQYKDMTLNLFNAAAATGDAGQVADYIAESEVYLGLDLSVYNKFSDEERVEICTVLMKNAPYESKSDIQKGLSESVLKQVLKGESYTDEEKKSMLDGYITSLGSEFEPLHEFIGKHQLEKNIADALAKNVDADFAASIKAVTLVAYFGNIANVYALESVFGEDNIFDIPADVMTKYEGYTDKTQFYTYLYNNAAKITSLESFYKLIEDYVPQNKATEKPTYGSSGNRGGGGGGISVSLPVQNTKPTQAPAATVEPKPEKEPEKEHGTFSDVPDTHWAKKEIAFLHEMGAVNGNENGDFLPDNSITREEFVKIISQVFSLEEKSGVEMNFADVDADKWYAEPIRICVSNGIVNGISDTSFGVGSNITRQDAAAIISRLYPDDTEQAPAEFADGNDIADYAKDAVARMKNMGIIGGYQDNTFRPAASITRAEAVKMIYGLYQKITGGTIGE